MNTKIKSIQGFTLVEIIIVVIVLAILSAIAYPNLASWVTKSKVNTIVGNCKKLEQAANEKYIKDDGTPMTTASEIEALLDNRTLTDLKIVDYTYDESTKMGRFEISPSMAKLQNADFSGAPGITLEGTPEKVFYTFKFN